MSRVAIEGVPAESVEDGGQAVILEINPHGPTGLFVRFQSWDESPERAHAALAPFRGKRLRVTIETIED